MSLPKPPRVLVIDDEPDILSVIRMTLRARGGFDVEVCESSADALELARRFQPDVILLDVMMPGMDGPATFRALREDPQTSATPIAFMTAKTMTHEVNRYLEMGAAAVIAKPFDQRTLADEVKEIVSRASACAPKEEDDREFAELHDAYAEALPGKIREIRDLWARVDSTPDAEVARMLYLRVHSLAGTAGTYGYVSLGDAARRLERTIGVGTPDGARPDPDIRRSVPALIDALDAEARTGRTPSTGD